MVHNDPNDPVENGASAAMLSAANLVTLTATATDGDLDTATDTADIGLSFHFEDDGPHFDAHGTAPDLVTDDTEITDTDTQDFSTVFNPIFGQDGFKDADDDGAQDSDAVTYALGISGTGAISGLVDTLTGGAVLLYMDGNDVVGRTSESGPDVFRISVDANTGEVTQTQDRAVVHDDPTDPVESGASAAMLSAADLITLTAKATDGDLDTATDKADIGLSFHFEDDGPSGQPIGQESLEEDDLDSGNDQDSVDGLGDGSGTRQAVTVALANLVLSTGNDLPISYALNDVDPNLILPDLFSKGEQLFYVTTASDSDYKIEAFAGGANQRLVFTFSLKDNGDGTATASLVLNDQLDHAPFADGSEAALLLTSLNDWNNSGNTAVSQIDFSALLDIRDADGDPVVLGSAFLTFAIQDDIPIIAKNLDGTLNNILGGLVDFTTINGTNPNDFGGTSVASVTHSLNGMVGTDENDANNEAGNGTKTYTLDLAKIASTSIAGLQRAIIDNGTKAVFFTDGVGGVAGVYDASIDTPYFELVLDQDGAGSYTFNVLKDPPPSSLQFDFLDLPSGQNLHGTIAVDKLDATKGGLLLFPKGALLDGAGVMTNLSPTTNTSKGGGPVTIGNTNQMFDPGEGHYFVFVDNPDHNAIAGVGLNQNNADDADTVGFNGTIEVNSAEVEIVQVQGKTAASVKITAFDLNANLGVGSDAGETNPRLFVTDPQNYDDNDLPEIIAVRVYAGTDGSRVLIEDTSDLAHYDAANVNVTFNKDGSVTVTGIQANYTIAWDTAQNDLFDMALVEDVAGKYDIGGFNLAQAQPTPDQQFDFQVKVTDYDGDTATSNSFSVGVDGTGSYDNDNVALVGVSQPQENMVAGNLI